MNAIENYKQWVENTYFDEATRNELILIQNDKKEIEERFYRDLEFGTGGLRGIIGAGTNRMNKYTVAKASQGLANYIISKGTNAMKAGLVIAYDSRHMSPEFALEAALVFTGNGIKTYLFDELRPTPELSFAVRYLKASGGIVLTASHNPKEYNGYKVYGEDGGQLSLEGSDAVLEEINRITDITSVKSISKKNAVASEMLKYIGSEIDDVYMDYLKTLSINTTAIREAASTMKIIYTPIHGTGNKPVRRILKETGFDNVIVVKEQELPDPNFSTVKSPNPEEKSAFKLAIELAKKENVELIIGTDPDTDRIGVVVKNSEGEYEVLTGNQTGCLLLEYILSQKQQTGTLLENSFVVKTIVTTELSKAIAANYNVELIEVLTGFKFIGEKIMELDENGDKNYLFGFEESYGYLAGTLVRDKDAVVAAMLIAEMAAFYKTQGKTLYDALMNIYAKYDTYIEGITSFSLAGKEGVEKINKAMNELRHAKPVKFGISDVFAIRDYLSQSRLLILSQTDEKIDLPKSNVLYYEMVDGSWFCVRPSGTEPKIKIYYGVKDKSIVLANAKLEALKKNVLGVIQKLLE